VRKLIVALLAALLPMTLIAGQAGGRDRPGVIAVAPHHVGSFAANQSNNWSGYNQGTLEKGGKMFHAVAGTWTVPRATAHRRGEQEFSATWAGIGGGCIDAGCNLTDNTLIQAGTEQDVDSSGKTSYSSWWEIIPAPSINTPLAVSPGNRVHVDISEVAPELWSIKIQNLSTNKAWAITVPYTSSYATAEWINETPLTCCPVQVGPLPNLSTVNFDFATTNHQPAGLAASEEVQLIDLKGHVVATPSAPDSDRDGFNDCAYASSCGVPPS
jgi:hypothetical protein